MVKREEWELDRLAELAQNAFNAHPGPEGWKHAAQAVLDFSDCMTDEEGAKFYKNVETVLTSAKMVGDGEPDALIIHPRTWEMFKNWLIRRDSAFVNPPSHFFDGISPKNDVLFGIPVLLWSFMGRDEVFEYRKPDWEKEFWANK